MTERQHASSARSRIAPNVRPQARARLGQENGRGAHAEVSKMRIPNQRRLMYVSTIVMLIVYASAIILLVSTSGGCALSAGFTDGW
jgi:hypothetical protein